MTVLSKLTRKSKTLAQFRADQSGLAMVEFAFAAPVVLALGMLGTETAHFVVTHMQLSQLAMQVADNTSRVGETDVLMNRRVFEADINDSLIGGERLGETIDIYGQGRVIVSSLQVNENENGQEIRWQRCRGAKNFVSQYGEEGIGRDDSSFQGMGADGRLITASPGTAVMFVEVSYTYEALTPFDFLDGEEIVYEAAFNVRDARNLEGLFQRNENDPDPVADCETFSADRPT